jgi:hypothetical protein
MSDDTTRYALYINDEQVGVITDPSWVETIRLALDAWDNAVGGEFWVEMRPIDRGHSGRGAPGLRDTAPYTEADDAEMQRFIEQAKHLPTRPTRAVPLVDDEGKW